MEPGDIERVLESMNGVTRALVRLLEHETGPQLVAYLSGTYDEQTIREQARSKLAEGRVPGVIVKVTEWPLTANGKLDVTALPTPDYRVVYEPPTTATEKQLAAIWCEVMERERVGRQDDFLRCGGHSLLATRVLMRIRERFGLNPTLATLFEAPVLEVLARRLDELLSLRQLMEEQKDDGPREEFLL